MSDFELGYKLGYQYALLKMQTTMGELINGTNDTPKTPDEAFERFLQVRPELKSKEGWKDE